MKALHVGEITIGIYPIESTVVFCSLLACQNNTSHTREFFCFLSLQMMHLRKEPGFNAMSESSLSLENCRAEKVEGIPHPTPPFFFF